MNAYFMIVLMAVVLFYVVWGLGWFLERLSHSMLDTTRSFGSRAWYFLVGPGVALHETSHALGCVFTRTKIVEFKPINVTVQDDHVVLGYVKYHNPPSVIKRTVINLAPVAVSLVLLTFLALGATYLVPPEFRAGVGGEALTLLTDLLEMKSSVTAAMFDPVLLMGNFVYTFFYAFAGLTVLNPLFWIVAFLAMTIMFSNAPSDVDIRNAAQGLKYIMVFNMIWLVLAAILPAVGWVAIGLYELLAVLFSLAIGFAIVAYGFFIMIIGLAKLRTPYNLIPFIASLITGIILFFNLDNTVYSLQFQTIVSLGVLALVMLLLLMFKSLRGKE
ncbi:MAG: hypothetical protein RTU30_09355 [Candidatus Thorarchaeota archaeon]